MTSNEPAPDSADDAQEPTVPADALPPRIISATELFAGRREVWIELGDTQYRLRITSHGKLLLTK